MDLGLNYNNINHFIDDKYPEQDQEVAFSNFWYSCKIQKIKHLIEVLQNNIGSENVVDTKNNYKYFISSDCDIWFVKKNINEWINLQKYIDESEKDIFFMREHITTDINGGFFIIKNNKNLIIILNFFKKIYNILLNINFKDNHLAHQTLINEYKSEINYDYIPNEFGIWGYHIFDKNKSLFHHPVCCFTIQQKRAQIESIKFLLFSNKIILNNINKTYNIVIAKYKENLDWVDKLDKSKVIIYDKSDNPVENSISRPNIGRDPETFLYHIVQNYENLPDYLIFLQGEPFFHFNDLSVNKNNLQEKITDLVKSNIVDVLPLFTNMYIEDINAYPSMKINKYYSLLFENIIINSIEFSSGCQYIVSKQNILFRPKYFYQYIYKMCCNSNVVTINESYFNNNEFDISQMDPWCFERFLFSIFNTKINISREILINDKTDLINN
jgi:hypothetical protein